MPPPILTALALLLAASAHAQDFSFVGRKPDLSGNRKLHVVKGVDPGVPVVFDTVSSERVVLRPATPAERSTPENPVYRFEWQKDKSIFFFELIDPDLLKRLDQQNTRSTASADGKAYELRVITAFFDQGKTLQLCVPSTKSARGVITAYIKVGASGEQEQALVLPEGGIAQCIMEATRSYTYPIPPASPFVAKAVVNVTE
ncbi:hypothetical protein WNB94_16910 [Aquabacterium sp. A3]|uniref:hypothetical protein n=1 Tax=Aquabacterium sp. A3 TaxID=3132829 RepID=UPI00311A28F6